MRMLKKVAAVLAATMLIAGVFAGCGSKKDDVAGVNIVPGEAAATILEQGDFVHAETMMSAEGDVAENYYPGIGELEYAVLISAFGATAEEVAVFKGDAAKAKELVDARLAYQIASFENYLPQEMEKLNNPVIETRGDVVYFVVTDTPEKARETIDSLYQ